MGKNKVLAPWLKDKYEVKNGEIIAKEKLHYVINGEKKELPDGSYWINSFGTKDNPDYIVNCIPLITHAHCLQLASEYNDIIKLHKAKRTVVRWPFDDPDLHGYMYMEHDTCWADGETHKETLNRSMWPYCNTMLVKRCEDRFILRALGLYEQGFYSEVEFGGDTTSMDITKDEDFNKTRNTLTNHEREAIIRRELLKDIGEMLTKLKEAAPNAFDGKIYIEKLIGKAPADNKLTNFTTDELRTIYKSFLNELKGFE